MNRLADLLCRLAGGFLLAMLASGCNHAALISMITPTAGLSTVHVIAYGDHARQKLDVYSPQSRSESPLPVVIFFYGGGWEDGERGDYLFAAEALVSRGYLAVVPDYRVYPEVRFPAFVQDGANATAWVLDNIDTYGGDPRRVYVMGHSAGAHIAAMLTFDQRYLRAAGHDPVELAGFIGLAGPYDFLPLESRTLKAIFGPPSRHPLSQPVNFVDGDEPPVYLLHGENDQTVWLRNTRRLAARIAEMNGQVKTRIYRNLGHTQIAAALSRPFRGWAPVLEDVGAFIDANQRRP